MSNAFDKASLVMIPGAYKKGKVMSVKPVNGAGDFTFSRNSTATRVNADGDVESVATNMPRLDYSGGAECPVLLIEPARTNLFLNSDSPATQTIAVADATEYTVSVTGSGTVTLSGAATGVASAGSDLTVTTSGTSLTCTVAGGPDTVQVEAGDYATSYIPTTGSVVSRVNDIINVQDLLALGVSNNSEGVLLLDFEAFYTNNNAGEVGIGGVDPTDRLALRYTSSGDLSLRDADNDPLFASLEDTAGKVNDKKYAIRWNGTTVSLFINGTKTGEVNAVMPTAMDRIRFGIFLGYSKTNKVVLYKNALTDAECQALTS